MALRLRHQSKVQFLRRLRERYRAASKLEACRLAYRMLQLLDDGDVTLAQMTNAWNMTSEEWATKRAGKLQPRADKWAAYKAALNTADAEGTD